MWFNFHVDIPTPGQQWGLHHLFTALTVGLSHVILGPTLGLPGGGYINVKIEPHIIKVRPLKCEMAGKQPGLNMNGKSSEKASPTYFCVFFDVESIFRT